MVEPNLYIGNSCLAKHPFFTRCFGVPVEDMFKSSLQVCQILRKDEMTWAFSIAFWSYTFGGKGCEKNLKHHPFWGEVVHEVFSTYLFLCSRHGDIHHTAFMWHSSGVFEERWPPLKGFFKNYKQ